MAFKFKSLFIAFHRDHTNSIVLFSESQPVRSRADSHHIDDLIPGINNPETLVSGIHIPSQNISARIGREELIFPGYESDVSNRGGGSAEVSYFTASPVFG